MYSFTRFLSALVIAYAGLHTAAAQGIAFDEGDWDDLRKKAKETNKLIFLYAYASWCGPCKWMAKNVFTTEEAGAYFNAHFMSLV